MKKSFISGLLCLFALCANASGRDSAKSVYPLAAFSIGYGLCPALGKSVGSLEVGAEVRLSVHWNVALLAFISGQKLRSGYGYAVEQPGLSLASVGLSGGYTKAIGRHISAKAAIMFGITTATLQDRSESSYRYTGKAFIRQYKAVDKATFFLAQPSLSVSYHLSPAVAVALNGRYDYTSGRAHWTEASAFSGFRADVGLIITPERIR